MTVNTMGLIEFLHHNEDFRDGLGENHAEALSYLIDNEKVTKGDIALLRLDMSKYQAMMTARMDRQLIYIGVMIAATAGVLGLIFKFSQ